MNLHLIRSTCAHRLETDMLINAGQWWSAALPVGLLVVLAFDQAYNCFVFQLMRVWGSSGSLIWDECCIPLRSQASKKVTELLNLPWCCCQEQCYHWMWHCLPAKKDGLQSIMIASLHIVAPQVPKFLFISGISSYLYVSSSSQWA